MLSTMQLSTQTSNSLVLDTKAVDFMLMCGNDVYMINREAFASRSPYFDIVCYTDKANKERFIKLPEKKRRHVRAMMHYFQVNVYHGPLDDVVPAASTPCKKNSEQKAGDNNGMSVEFRSKDASILSHFPEFEYSWILHGDRALKACKLITHHETFDVINTHGFEFVAPGEYRCQPEALPQPLQISLFNFLMHLKVRRTDIAGSPVFHAEMYNHIALKYMIPELGPRIVSAFESSVQAWINTSLIRDNSFITAAAIILRPLLNQRFGPAGDENRDSAKTQVWGQGPKEHWEMANALVRVMASNWGWMKYDEDVLVMLGLGKYKPLKEKVEEEVQNQVEHWKKRLEEREASPVWSDREEESVSY